GGRGEARGERGPGARAAARPAQGGGGGGGAGTIPARRVGAVGGVVEGSLFGGVEQSGESARLVLGLVDIFSSDFVFTADTRAGDRFRLLVEKRYAGDTFVDYGRILVAQYKSGGKTLSGVGFDKGSTRFAHYSRT